jgi:pyruvate/2-oxoglutarate dehydrogenase complex dihydrolipoamide dehydrogenase (E3) component
LGACSPRTPGPQGPHAARHAACYADRVAARIAQAAFHVPTTLKQREKSTVKTVAITGASAGVGCASAHAFARLGANVALLARDPRALDDTASEVRAFTAKARRTGAEAGLGASRALAFAAVFAVLAAGFVAARKLDR